MTALRPWVLLGLMLQVAAAHAHPGHDPEGLHQMIHALADLDPRTAALPVIALVAGLIAWRQRAAARVDARRPPHRDR